ncbi:MAG TPA: hypothetical protein VHI76_06985 [Solirubrobacterales bacterium]|nr:hypothetical protein [Solirubrobacterales bacterium]
MPVVTDAGALLEVVGDTGVRIDSSDPDRIADRVLTALELGLEGGERARRRVLEEFTYERRRDGICHEVELALSG